MRVLHIGKYFPPFAGGIEYFLADLLSVQRQQGIQTAALVHDHRKNFLGHRPSAHDSADKLAPLIYRVPCYGSLLYAPISPQFPWWLAKTIREFKPDLLHLHLPNTSAFWTLLVPAARRIPWVIHWHADVVASQIDRRLGLAYRFYQPWEQRLLAASHAVIVTSPNYLNSSKTLQPWREKCHIIPLGLNPARIPIPDEESLNWARQLWGEASFKILTVGRLAYFKGHEVLIRAIKDMPDIKLVIVGEGSYRNRLEHLIESLKLKDKVSLIGSLGWKQAKSALNALFATCDVFCLPSVERAESFGLVLLESMHFHKPVIASDIPGSGVGWVVRQAGNGLLVEPGNHQALTLALEELVQSPQQRGLFGQRGSRALHTHFHIRQVAQKTLSLYENLLYLSS